MSITYDTAVVMILVLLIPTMFCLGFVCRKPEYRQYQIRTITAKIGEDKRTYEIDYPFNTAEDTNYIFLVDFPKGQQEASK